MTNYKMYSLQMLVGKLYPVERMLAKDPLIYILSKSKLGTNC